MITCPHCSRRFNHRRYLRSHITRLHPSSQSPIQVADPGNASQHNVVVDEVENTQQQEQQQPLIHVNIIPPTVRQSVRDVSKRVYNFYATFNESIYIIFKRNPLLSPA